MTRGPAVKVLVTGFKPYRNITVNTSAEVATALDKSGIDGVEIHTAVLPVSFTKAAGKIVSLLDEIKPGVLVMLGIASRTTSLRIEKAALNVYDKSKRQIDLPIDPEGPAAYLTPWPVAKLLKTLKRADIPACRSCHAGAYVCNYIFYTAARHIEGYQLGTRYGFVHLPCLPGEAARLGPETHASMSLKTATEGVKLIIKKLVK